MQKPIEVGKGKLGYYIFPKGWTVKEGLNRQMHTGNKEMV